MDRILSERVVFPEQGRSFLVRGFSSVNQLAILRERSKRKGKVSKDLLTIRALEMGIVEPDLDEQAVLDLMRDEPQIALLLAERIVALTTG